MSVFNYEGPVEELSSGGVQHGPVELTVSSAEIAEGKASGTRYLKVTMTDANNYEVKHNFFPFSQKDYPKKALANFLAVCGFWNGAKIDINEWALLVGKRVIAICQLEEYYWDGKNRKKRVPHSFYNADSYKSGNEICENKTEALSFTKNKTYVDSHPTIGDAPATTPEAGDMPF